MKSISSIVGILVNYLLYSYIVRLENTGCDCDLFLYGTSIKSSIILNYILIFGNYMYEDNIPLVTKFMIFIYNMISSVNTFVYLYLLKNKKSKCSDSMIRDVYFYYYYLNFLLAFVLLSMVVILMITK